LKILEFRGFYNGTAFAKLTQKKTDCSEHQTFRELKMKFFSIAKQATLTAAFILGAASSAFSGKIGLKQVMLEVCTKSDSVKMMQETLVKSDLMIREKWSSALPAISASVSGGRSISNLTSTMPSLAQMMPPGMSTTSDVTHYATSIDVAQPIYTFGKIGAAIDVARQFDKSVKSSYARNLQQLQLLSLDAFYRVVLTEIALGIAKRSQARKSELYDHLERNLSLGSGTKAQVLAAKAEQKGQVPAIIKAQEDLLGACMGLAMLMGRPPEDSIELDTASSARELLTIAIPPRQEAIRKAQVQREDIRMFDFLAAACKGGAKIYRSMYLPNIVATGSLGTVGTRPDDLGDWKNKNATVGIGLQWQLFDGFADKSVACQYRSDARKLELVRNAVAKGIVIEVSAAHIECAAADSNLAATEEMLAAAQESYKLTNDNFKQGSGQFADLQLAEERLRQAEMGITGASYRQVRSRAALLVAMGKNIINLEEP
jgi:outer membrane protein